MKRLFGLACLLACSAHAPPRPREHVSGPGYDGVLFSADYAHSRDLGLERRAWTPTPKMVGDFERRLAGWLRERHLALPSNLPLERQYLGLYADGSGARVLRARVMCPSLYSEDRVEVLPDFQYYGPSECLCVGWYDPASKRILAFGCSNTGSGLPPTPPALDRRPLQPASSHAW
jgi:hypothetical protein